MNRASAILLTGLLVVLPMGLAFSADLAQLPTGPAAWTIDVVPSHAVSTPAPGTPPAQAGQNRIVKIVVTQDDEKRRSLVTYTSGQTYDRWEIPRLNCLMSEDPAGTAFAVTAHGRFPVPFVSYNFQWLSLAMRQENDPVSYQGEQCYHYKGSVARARLAGLDLDAGTTTVEAWIDSKNLMPVAIDDGTLLGTYTYSKIPPPPLILPPKFQRVFDQFQGAMGILKPVVAH